MLKIDSQTEHISLMHERRMSQEIVAVRKLSEICIDELRRMNDEATAEELPRNQGRIDAFKVLLDAIDNGIPQIAEHLRRQTKKT